VLDYAILTVVYASVPFVDLILDLWRRQRP
jgi:hypothetical protein